MENRRKIVMINKKFQITLIVKFLIVNVCVLSLFGVLLYMFFNSEIEANLASAHVTYQNVGEMLLPIVITLSVINIIISSVIITVFVLFASFRIAGPLYRFNAAIKEISQGNLIPLLKLRDKDELTAFSESLQEMAQFLISITKKGKELSTELKKVDELKNNETISKKVKEIDDIVDNLKY